METQFRNLDRAIDSQPMPPQFQDTKAMVSCNDCYAKSAVKYHWLGLKCAICDSYNTAQLSILSDPAVEVPMIESREIEHPAVLEAAGESAIPAQLGPGPVRHRRHSSHVHTRTTSDANSNGLFPYHIPQRIGRSVSPFRREGFFNNVVVVAGETDESGDDDDELDFWGRDEHRSVTSAENIDDDMDEDDESDDDSVSVLDDCDDEAEDEDQFELLGHR